MSAGAKEARLRAEIERMISTERMVTLRATSAGEFAGAKHRIDALSKVLDFMDGVTLAVIEARSDETACRLGPKGESAKSS
jgi:hypothetical protein